MVDVQGDAGGGVFGTDPRSAQRPACTRNHVHAKSQPPRFGQGIAQLLHPRRAEKGDIPLFLACHAIDRTDFDAAKARRLDQLKVARNFSFVDRAAHPPPARPRQALAGCRRPQDLSRTVVGVLHLSLHTGYRSTRDKNVTSKYIRQVSARLSGLRLSVLQLGLEPEVGGGEHHGTAKVAYDRAWIGG